MLLFDKKQIRPLRRSQLLQATAQTKPHAADPDNYPDLPLLAITSKIIPNPTSVNNENYQSYKKPLSALTAFISMVHADAEPPLLSGTYWTLTSVRETKHKCSTVKANSSIELARINFPYAPVSAKDTDGIIEILYSCGTECSITYLILPDNKTSGPYSLVDTVDYKKGTLLSISRRELKIFKFPPAVKGAIKSVKADIPKDATLPSRVVETKLNYHIYSIIFRDKDNHERHIDIEQ
ncbi:hypothetical protein ACFPTX_12860 [Pseudomonas sp. GCM10022188]|uniref:hypothetical protein n=1 Tax=Pseudomonas TaxID=286 RepID=UPI001E2949D1|nr:hypothetical protein [Pseudomonas oryzagri]MCC6075358.1 hypothetical protein [Pseudomonas oryzagri]